MYLKFKTSPESNGWRLYEADDIQWHYFTVEEFEAMIRDSEQLEEVNYEDFTGEDKPDCEVVMVTFSGKDGSLNEIYTINEAFVLNSNGKTLERIN